MGYERHHNFHDFKFKKKKTCSNSILGNHQMSCIRVRHLLSDYTLKFFHLRPYLITKFMVKLS